MARMTAPLEITWSIISNWYMSKLVLKDHDFVRNVIHFFDPTDTLDYINHIILIPTQSSGICHMSNLKIILFDWYNLVF